MPEISSNLSLRSATVRDFSNLFSLVKEVMFEVMKTFKKSPVITLNSVIMFFVVLLSI